ncbi:divalent-cation tolerance protein CutA [Dictyobacter kobayashii]|uniref:Uncharacterized protein n=1 Tax=Dictyobacter kobayashii TaxID=2014872 RepID=A0A402AK07_9CHLR|nr:divalent-cation tolerance protein CutA [Dictyobacter kobayashii]GCE19447.1 hypothetical protein KDK_32470 [Dictyobacter kobayashii]
MVQFIDVRTATAQKEDAQKIAKALVDQRCAASSQVSGPIESTYWWKGKMVTAEEWVVTAKTRLELYQKAEELIRQLHPYKEPGITAFPIVAGSPSYFQWISEETAMQETEPPLHNSADRKEQIIREFDNVYEQLVRAATAAAKRGVEIQNGEWGPREILAHIAGWAAQATTQLPQVIKGLPPIAYASKAQHAGLDEAANDEFIALIGNQAFEDVLNIAHKTHLDFVSMLRTQDKNNFVPNHYVYDRMKRVIEHHLQHAQELDQLCY